MKDEAMNTYATRELKYPNFINWIAFVRLSMGQPLRSLFVGAGMESNSAEIQQRMWKVSRRILFASKKNRFSGIFRSNFIDLSRTQNVTIRRP